jgi:hypothetical protein
VAAVGIDSGHKTCELRAAALHDAIAIRRVWRAQHGERNSAVPEQRSRDLPVVHNMPQPLAADLYRQLIHVLRVEIAANVIVAGP